MARLLTLLSILAFVATPVSAQPTPNLDSLYLVLDSTVERFDYYVKERTTKIDALKLRLAASEDLTRKYFIADSLFDMYHKLMKDSAVVYGRECISLAQQLDRSDLVLQNSILLANLYHECGAFDEAVNCFDKIKLISKPDSLLSLYYTGLLTLYGDMVAYSINGALKSSYMNLENRYRDSLFSVADTNSIFWISKKMTEHLNIRQMDEAMHYSDLWLQKVKPETPEFAEMAYFRACAYGILNDNQMQKSWFAVSAINDLKCCVMNQASLWTLARILSDEGDLQRAYKYVECSWKCVEMFNANLRNWQVSPVLKKINDNYKAQLTQKNSVLMWFVALISVLTLILLALYIYAMRKRRQLAAMRNELKDTNEELALLNLKLSNKNTELSDANTCLNNTNTLLSESNRQLSLSISHLNDSNRIKDEYIGKFLSICSEYIEKLDSYRIKINRKLKAGQYADLLRITGSQQLREDELKELLENFDSVFLRLFPTFVDDFNTLLKPQERVSLPEKGKLNTDLRIFALIRLGIDESSKIAEFLHYSPNSIYAYRARIKNKAISDRNEFEKLVKEIGI